MSTVNYPSSSPYSLTPQLNWRLGIYAPIAIPPDASDVLIPNLGIQYTQNPMLLSQDTYGAPTLWWVFSVRNIDIVRDPIWDLVAGINIYAPTLKYLNSLGITV